MTADGQARELPESWGFTDGQHLYIRRQGHYRQLARQGNSFGFMGLPEPATRWVRP